MSEKRYTASLSRSQGRSGWSIIFRHPVRSDDAPGKGGLRVRHGLATADDGEAERLKNQLNELLSDAKYWDIAARAEAQKRFDPRIVEIFYYKLQPEETDFFAVRQQYIPLPNSEENDYRRLLLLGTTGGGKTTLLRQLIGTDPKGERFPSTSTAKTTIHDTEVILDSGPFRAAVTFFPVDEVREHINECISKAVLEAYRMKADDDVMRKILVHVGERFRFNYVLGDGPISSGTDFEDEDDEDDEEQPTPGLEEATAVIDLKTTNSLLISILKQVHALAERHGRSLRDELGTIEEKDERVVDELFEEELDSRLRKDENFHKIADQLLDEIEKRFELLDPKTVQYTKQGWPQTCSWETEDRLAFVRAVSRFSSNYAARFGYLLTPLVNGVRVAGPFKPEWADGTQPKLALLDGEGLGHTPGSSAAISTSLSRRIDAVDAVLLVDSATQPMQAAAIAAMRELVSTGNVAKLLVTFTHLDRMEGDNLPTLAAKKRYIMASAENVLALFGKELGRLAERALRQRLEKGCFFVGEIDRRLSVETKIGRHTVAQLRGLLTAIEDIIERPKLAESRPVYDRVNLVLTVKSAAENFRDIWWPRLGKTSKPGLQKEHWTRIKALSRRLATPGWADGYDNLMPVADLRRQLQLPIYVLIQSPLRWNELEPSDDDKQVIFNKFANSLSGKLLDLAATRVRAERIGEWQKAYQVSGPGSSYTRASIIADEIYDRAAPVPDMIPTPDRNRFLHEVTRAVEEAAEEVGAKLV